MKPEDVPLSLPDRILAWVSCAIAGLLVGAAMLASDGDPASVIAALCLVPFLITPYVMPDQHRGDRR